MSVMSVMSGFHGKVQMVTVVDVGIDRYMQSIRIRSYYAILLGINPQVSIRRLMVVEELKLKLELELVLRTGVVSEAKKRKAKQSRANQSKAKQKQGKAKQSRPMRIEYKWGCRSPTNTRPEQALKGGGCK